MSVSKGRNEKKVGVILSYMSEGVYILSSLLYTPIMLRLLGQSEYGLYQLSNSLVAYMSLLSLGFGSSYMRFYSREKLRNNNGSVAKLNGMYMLIFIIISIICVVTGEILILNLNAIMGSKLSLIEIEKSKILMHFMVFNMALSFPSSIFNCIITANEKFIFQKGLILLSKILNPFLSLILLFLGYDSIGLVIVSTIVAVGTFASNAYFCFVELKTKFIFRDFNWLLLKEMWAFTFFIFLNQIIDQINWNLDKFLLGRMVGTTSVAVYSIGANFNTMFFSFSTSVSNVFYPEVNKLVAEGNNCDKLLKLMIRLGRIQFMILFLFLSGFIIFGQSFTSLWAGKEYVNAYYIAILLMGTAIIPLIQEIGLEIQRAMNKHKIRSIVYLSIVVMNIGLSVHMIRIMGEQGAAIGTAVATILGTGIFVNLYYHYSMQLNMRIFWKNIMKLFPAAFVMLGVGFLGKTFIGQDSIITLFIQAIAYTIIYFVVFWLIGMNNYEKDLLLTSVNRIRRR